MVARELADGTAPVWAIPAHQLRPILARAIAAPPPRPCTDEVVVRTRGRQVAYYPTSPTGPAPWSCTAPTTQLAAAYDHLDTTARAARRAGAPETLDQLRYDLAVGALTDGASLTVTQHRHRRRPAPDAAGRQRSRPRRATLIDVTRRRRPPCSASMTSPPLLRTPAGDVPISAALARAPGRRPRRPTWRRILCDPATGTATDVSPTTAPATRIADYVKVRDGHTSRHPTSAARTPRARPHPPVQPRPPRHRRTHHPRQPRRRRQTRPPSQNRPASSPSPATPTPSSPTAPAPATPTPPSPTPTRPRPPPRRGPPTPTTPTAATRRTSRAGSPRGR